MLGFMMGALVGLVIGWNVLPQPVWVKALYTRWFGE